MTDSRTSATTKSICPRFFLRKSIRGMMSFNCLSKLVVRTGRTQFADLTGAKHPVFELSGDLSPEPPTWIRRCLFTRVSCIVATDITNLTIQTHNKMAVQMIIQVGHHNMLHTTLSKSHVTHQGFPVLLIHH